jgi:hypothetical protein
MDVSCRLSMVRYPRSTISCTSIACVGANGGRADAVFCDRPLTREIGRPLISRDEMQPTGANDAHVFVSYARKDAGSVASRGARWSACSTSAASRLPARSRRHRWNRSFFRLPGSLVRPINLCALGASRPEAVECTKEGQDNRLPTEAEWEYACRAGTTTPYFSGNDPETLASVGNVADGTAKAKFSNWNSIAGIDGYVYTAPVARFQASAVSLFDAHGNVSEWCKDRYDPDYYGSSPIDDPVCTVKATLRVVRGGTWRDSPSRCRSAVRYWSEPAERNIDVGFRVARSQSER